MCKTLVDHKTMLSKRNGKDIADSDKSPILFSRNTSTSINVLNTLNRSASCVDTSDRTESYTSSSFNSKSSCDGEKYESNGSTIIIYRGISRKVNLVIQS